MSIPEDIRDIAKRAALVNDFEGRCIAIGKAIQAERDKKSSRHMSLTSSQNELLDYIRTYINENDGVAPSINEMTVALDKGRSRVHAQLVQLEERGRIKRIPYAARAIQIIGG